MHFIKGKTNIDLGDTPVENIFIDDFMPAADGNYVKVYLLGYKYACNQDSSTPFSNEHIARALGMLLSDVLKAWDYWEKVGIIKKHYIDENNKDNFTVEFLNLKQLVIDNIYRPITKEDMTYQAKGYSPSDLSEALKDQRIRDMFQLIQQLMCRPLNPSESLKCLEWLYDLKMPPEIIEEAFKYSVEKKGVKDIRYVNAIINNWYGKKINSMEKLEEHLKTTDKRYTLYSKVMKAVGNTNRNPSSKEKELMDKWFDQYGMPIEVVLKACDIAYMRKQNPTMAYIDGIITDWHRNKLNTLEKIELSEKENRTPRQKRKKSKLHYSNQPALKYTNEQLKEMLRRKNNM